MELNQSSKFKSFKTKETIQMGLDLENTQSLMSILRDNIYSDPITSFVRELYSNAVDAHLRSNNTVDFINVCISQIESDYLFSVQDYGQSMNKDVITNIYSKMGKSDKRDSNDEMGAWGLGATEV